MAMHTHRRRRRHCRRPVVWPVVVSCHRRCLHSIPPPMVVVVEHLNVSCTMSRIKLN